MEFHLTRTDLENIFCDIPSENACPKRTVHCVIVKDGRILSAGYNRRLIDNPPCPRCDTLQAKTGDDYDLSSCIHAEQQALLNLERAGDARGAVACSSYLPCLVCVRLFITAGIAGVRYLTEWAYEDPRREAFHRLLRQHFPLGFEKL